MNDMAAHKWILLVSILRTEIKGPAIRAFYISSNAEDYALDSAPKRLSVIGKEKSPVARKNYERSGKVIPYPLPACLV
ncbi:hypothetical protein GFL09_15485 [Pseudomonas stutzeri]|uniref:hypothetical protein n=1 Tax=Stutzerimonas stutzeri TaxID=316 RepID=UPI0012602425|nr:hypothetical protein [Stutzerimonas stutzeri]MBK3869072.1 hypothetical protein [Stutzerimonas stutzeri]